MQIEFGVGNTKLSKVLKYYKANNTEPEKPKMGAPNKLTTNVLTNINQMILA